MMEIQNIFDWFNSNSIKRNRSWLILGKGPSYTAYHSYINNDYLVMGLNDTNKYIPRVDLAHFVDFEAFQRCSNVLEQTPNTVVVMPWFPHINNKPGTINLSNLSKNYSVLKKLALERRLCWYDLNSSPIRHGSQHTVTANFFSAEAALDILATAGVKKIRSLGIDGGNSYSPEFDDLNTVSLLTNGQNKFDQQFESFAKILNRTSVDYSPLGMETPIRVFVAASESEALPFKVLEYSIKLHASTNVSVISMHDVGFLIPKPIAPENQPRTPFSFQRFLIPKLCEYAGKAIYLDSDMLVFRDITSIWCRPFEGANVLSSNSVLINDRMSQYSVMLMDCSQLNWDIFQIVAQLDAGTLSYEQLMYEFALARAVASIEPEWNALETFSAGQTALLHYTDMNTQPWVSHLNPLGFLWIQALRQALLNGAISRTFIEDEVGKGHVRPSLLYQIDHEIDDAILLPRTVLALDSQFKPPYRNLQLNQKSTLDNRMIWLQAFLRSNYQKTLIYKFKNRILRRLKKQFGR